MNAQIKMIFAFIGFAALLTACGASHSSNSDSSAPMTIQLISPAFAEGQPIPAKFAYDQQNVSPALQWSGVPSSAKSLALICDDPDAPAGTWVHWVIYDLPANATNLPEAVAASPELPDGTRQGLNDFKQTGYGGPAPPPGKMHHYFFKLYALDIRLGLKPGVTKADLRQAMNGHILAQGQLMGTFQH